jgi:hypothetical protein
VITLYIHAGIQTANGTAASLFANHMDINDFIGIPEKLREESFS